MIKSPLEKWQKPTMLEEYRAQLNYKSCPSISHFEIKVLVKVLGFFLAFANGLQPLAASVDLFGVFYGPCGPF